MPAFPNEEGVSSLWPEVVWVTVDGVADTSLPIKLDPLTILPREEEGAKPVDKEPSNDFAEANQQLNSRPERTKKQSGWMKDYLT